MNPVLSSRIEQLIRWTIGDIREKTNSERRCAQNNAVSAVTVWAESARKSVQ